MENKFRWLCELCTAFSFTALVINFFFYFNTIDYNVYICSVAIVTCTFVANASSDNDKSLIEKGILYSKRQKISKICVCILRFRMWLEHINGGILIALMLAYLFTASNKGTIFDTLAYYEMMLSILIVTFSKWILFLLSLILMGIESCTKRNNTMRSMMQ